MQAAVDLLKQALAIDQKPPAGDSANRLVPAPSAYTRLDIRDWARGRNRSTSRQASGRGWQGGSRGSLYGELCAGRFCGRERDSAARYRPGADAKPQRRSSMAAEGASLLLLGASRTSDRGTRTVDAVEPARSTQLHHQIWLGHGEFYCGALPGGAGLGRPIFARAASLRSAIALPGCPPRPSRPSCGGAGSVAAVARSLPNLNDGKLLGGFGGLQYVRKSARGSRGRIAQGRTGGAMTQTRRLAAILAADVAGYSRLIGADEGGTLERLRALRRELLDPKIAEHKGRLVKTTGDGLLVEFGSVVDALRCAVEVQHEMAGRNTGVPPDNRIELRIGINVGDIVVEDGDIFGDGVNVAPRLEALAEPGGICVAARVQEDAAGKLDLAFEDIGEQQLKNIARPVRACRVITSARPAGLQLNAGPPLPDKPSIAVLPFANMSGDPEQEYFADGMVEEIITALSRIRWLFVIARNSSFTYKGQTIDVKRIGH